MIRIPIAILAISLLSASCGKDGNDDNTDGGATSTSILSVVQTKYGTAVTQSNDGTSITLRSDGRPDHKTPYWGVGHAKYEAFPTGHASNPGGQILAQTYVMTIPIKPTGAATHEATSLGPIGMALNGVAIYNNTEMTGPLERGTITSFDKAGAHPAQRGDYHYHVTGEYTTVNDSKLVGFLRDGFPLYGRLDMDGTRATNLDAYNGHTAATTEFPSGIYHYHVENVNYLNTGFYILKSGSYYGAKGTFTY